PNPTPRVLIIGGGLAGMAAAAALEQAGCRVTLVEARHALGGRAGSFSDPESGQLLDSSQHVLLGCCVNLLDLYRRLGVADKIHWQRQVHFLKVPAAAAHPSQQRAQPVRRYDLWGLGALPAPLHMGLAFAGFGLLSVGERLALVRAMLAMLRLGKAGREDLEQLSFGVWLAQHNQPAALTHKFYEPVLISALNIPCERASAKYAIQVFQDALLGHNRGYVVGLAACPLEELYGQLPVGDVRLNSRVAGLLWDGLRVSGVKLQNGEELAADAVVLATNYPSVIKWVADLPIAATHPDERLRGLREIQSVPILGAHLWFDRPVMTEPALAIVEETSGLGGGLQWLFRKDDTGCAVQGVISAATEYVDRPRDETVAQLARQVVQIWSARAAGKGEATPQLVRGSIVIEKRATFAPLPGVDKLRPLHGPGTVGVRGLYLAGDYTKTDWPATMEGAVRSGYLAAEAVLADAEGQPHHRFLVEDLPVQWPARWLGLE
ncbi:MAG: hydroxysqualene dehydroxylase HpnE, partial [Phycisphaerae bacterium]